MVLTDPCFALMRDPCAGLNGNGLNGAGTLKGDPVMIFGSLPRSTAGLSDRAVDMGPYNMATVQVFVTGTNPSGIVSVEGGAEQAAIYLPVPDPNGSKVVTASVSFDVVCGARWAKVRLASVSGTYLDGQGFTVWVTPYVSPGQPRVTADHLGAGQTAYNTGVGFWLEVNGGVPRMSVGDPSAGHLLWDGSALTIAGHISALSGSIDGLLTIGAGGSIEALGAGSAKAKIDATGLKLYNAAGLQKAELLNDGSGWLGDSAVFAWTAAGVVTLNGSAVMPNTITGGKVNFFNVPTIDGLVLTNNSPGAGSVAWSQFTLTYQGTSYTVAAGNTASKFIWWNKATSTTVLQTGATPPAQAADQFIVAFNKSGTAVGSLFANIVYADYISAVSLAAIQANIGAAHIDGVLDIATTGGIYQGSGSFASPTTGLKVWNDTGVGRIAGYNATVLQWYASTDGKLYAGAGNTLIDANGLSLLAANVTPSRVKWIDTDGLVLGQIVDYVAGATPNRGSTLSMAANYEAGGTGRGVIHLAVAAVHSIQLNGYTGYTYFNAPHYDFATGEIAFNGPSASFGASPAASGLLRLPVNQWITARNKDNNGDVNLAKVNTSNLIELGASISLASSSRYIRSAAQVTLAANDTTVVPATLGLLVVDDDTNNGCGIYVTGGGSQALISSSGGAWDVGAGAPGNNKIRVYWDGGAVNFKIINRYGVDHAVSWYTLCC